MARTPPPEIIAAAKAAHKVWPMSPASVAIAQWEIESLYVRPRLPASDRGDATMCDAEHSAERSVAFRARSDEYNVSLFQLPFGRALAARLGAVGDPVRRVFSSRRPAKIRQRIVGFYSISMRDLVSALRRLAQKSECHEAIDTALPPLRLRVDGRDRIPIFIKGAFQDASDERPFAVALAPNPTAIAHRIFGREWDRLPNLTGIIGISHIAVLRVCGQGRAVFAAPFRPAFCTGFPRQSEGLSA